VLDVLTVGGPRLTQYIPRRAAKMGNRWNTASLSPERDAESVKPAAILSFHFVASGEHLPLDLCILYHRWYK
jgi:hypothetical protein